MKFTIEKETIAKSLKSAASVAGRKTSVPILSFIKLSAAEAKLTVCATDLEMGFQARHEAEVQEAGEICLPAKLLYDIVANLPAGAIEFADDDQHAMTIRAASGVYKIPGLGPDEFPSMADLAGIGLTSIEAKDLYGLIHKIIPACSTDATRANICGGFLRQSAGRLFTVATDGHRMAKATMSWEEPGECGLSKGVIIPRTALQELLHILDLRLDKAVMVGSSRSVFLLRVAGEDMTFHVKLIDGEYPDYGRVLPEEVTIPVVIRRDALLESLQRMNILAGRGFGFLTLTLAGAALRLTFENQDGGTAEETHEVRNIMKTECTARLDIGLLRSVVEATHEDEIVIDLSEGQKPLQVMNLSALEETEKDYIGIVMPLKM